MMAQLLLGVALLVGNAVVFALVLRSRAEPSHGLQPGSTVACPGCGEPNDAGYRFCRRCVGTLPGPDAYTPRGGVSDRLLAG